MFFKQSRHRTRDAHRKGSAWLITAALIVGVFIGYATGINRISGLQKRIEGLEAEVAKRDGTINSLQSTVSEREGRQDSALGIQVGS